MSLSTSRHLPRNFSPAATIRGSSLEMSVRSLSPSDAVAARSYSLSSFFVTTTSSPYGSIKGISRRSNPASFVLDTASRRPSTSNLPVQTEPWQPICMSAHFSSGSATAAAMKMPSRLRASGLLLRVDDRFDRVRHVASESEGFLGLVQPEVVGDQRVDVNPPGCDQLDRDRPGMCVPVDQADR